MSKAVLHQVTVGATPGDAITDHALLIRRWLREAGFESEIFAEHIHPALEKEIFSALTYKPKRDEEFIIYHHSIGSPVVERLTKFPLKLILVYHNITPPEFFTSINPALARELEEGVRQLQILKRHTKLALAVSPFNEQGLHAAGFSNTAVLPLALDEKRYNIPSAANLVAKFEQSGPLLLFVGRLVPNKKQEDLIKLLYYYRRLEPTARLVLVGEKWLAEYVRWLQDFVRDLGLEDSVLFTGHVSQQEMITYYRLADLYISMSEHEGFGKPLIESMYFDLPVLAYKAAGVPYTLGGAGVLVKRKEYEAIAELIDLLITDTDLRHKIMARQRRRVQDFLEAGVQKRLYESLSFMGQLSTFAHQP